MSNTTLSQQNLDSDEWDYILQQLEQQLPIREQVSTALKEANAAFAAQFTQPDGYKYMEACNRFAQFLDLKIPMDNSEQKSVVQVLQVACAMHENAVNNPALTATQRSAHYLSSTSLVSLCKSVLEGGVTHTELWIEVFNLTHRAEQAFSRATDALDLSKYLDFANMTDDYFVEPGNGASTTSPVPSPVPTASRLATPRASLHDITDVCQTPQSAKLKEKAVAMMNENDPPSKGAPLGRAHTMPSLPQTIPNSYFSRTGRAPSKAHSRGHGLSALQEAEE